MRVQEVKQNSPILSLEKHCSCSVCLHPKGSPYTWESGGKESHLGCKKVLLGCKKAALVWCFSTESDRAVLPHLPNHYLSTNPWGGRCCPFHQAREERKQPLVCFTDSHQAKENRNKQARDGISFPHNWALKVCYHVSSPRSQVFVLKIVLVHIKIDPLWLLRLHPG